MKLKFILPALLALGLLVAAIAPKLAGTHKSAVLATLPQPPVAPYTFSEIGGSSGASWRRTNRGGDPIDAPPASFASPPGLDRPGYDLDGGVPGVGTELKTTVVSAAAADSTGSIAGPLTATPEPASWNLLVVGFAGLGATLRAPRRRRGAA
jgi:hypothetical protein